MGKENFESSLPRKIEQENIEPKLPEIGGTEIILQRHGKYERSADSQNVGSLTEEGVQNIYDLGKHFFSELFGDASEEERAQIEILVIASDTKYMDGGQRSMETANEIIKALKEELEKFEMSPSQFLNSSGRFDGDGEARPTSKLREPQMFDNSPEFVEFLKEKYGDLNLDFWIAFEEDLEKDTREKMNAEGPDEIADRTNKMVKILARYARMYHKQHPGKRLIIWAATHYDTISPYVKRDIGGVSKEVPLGVDYGAGISINLDKDGKNSVKIAEEEYEAPLEDVSKFNK